MNHVINYKKYDGGWRCYCGSRVGPSLSVSVIHLLTSLRAAEAARPAYKLYSVFRFSHVTTLHCLVFVKLASISTRLVVTTFCTQPVFSLTTILLLTSEQKVPSQEIDPFATVWTSLVFRPFIQIFSSFLIHFTPNGVGVVP
jgi:hypothetical protein